MRPTYVPSAPNQDASYVSRPKFKDITNNDDWTIKPLVLTAAAPQSKLIMFHSAEYKIQ